ncbi:MAG: hypothetical protein HY700_10250 [Gemmatimonadetes bacterium]|nr:hypothetical protein [Gemmatimonadota bacterium]
MPTDLDWRRVHRRHASRGARGEQADRAAKILGVHRVVLGFQDRFERLFFGHCRMEAPWERFDFAVDVTAVYQGKIATLACHESVFSGDQARRYSSISQVMMPASLQHRPP